LSSMATNAVGIEISEDDLRMPDKQMRWTH
jgi:hypothetical protein